MPAESPRPAELIGLGASLVGFVILGLGLGWYLDSVFDTSPLLIMVGLGVGIACAVGSSIVQFRRFMK